MDNDTWRVYITKGYCRFPDLECGCKINGLCQLSYKKQISTKVIRLYDNTYCKSYSSVWKSVEKCGNVGLFYFLKLFETFKLLNKTLNTYIYQKTVTECSPCLSFEDFLDVLQKLSEHTYQEHLDLSMTTNNFHFSFVTKFRTPVKIRISVARFIDFLNHNSTEKKKMRNGDPFLFFSYTLYSQTH